MPEADASGVRIAYDDTGQGEPALLLLPGWCSSRAVFSRLASLLETRHRVLALDWRGHGESAAGRGDFGAGHLLDDARAVLARSGVGPFVPVAGSHAGWIALELCRLLRERVPKLVLLDWIVLEPPIPFLTALNGLQAPRHWQSTRERLLSAWAGGSAPAEVARHVRYEMGKHDFAMWARAAREIQWAYAGAGSPVRALGDLRPPVPTLHLYAQPRDEAYLAAQRKFAGGNPWFRVLRLDGQSHLPMLEMPEAVAEAVEEFLAG